MFKNTETSIKKSSFTLCKKQGRFTKFIDVSCSFMWALIMITVKF